MKITKNVLLLVNNQIPTKKQNNYYKFIDLLFERRADTCKFTQISVKDVKKAAGKDYKQIIKFFTDNNIIETKEVPLPEWNRWRTDYYLIESRINLLSEIEKQTLLSNYSSISISLSSISISLSSTHYNGKIENGALLDSIGVEGDLDVSPNSTLPLFIGDVNNLKIPSKVYRKLERNSTGLMDIHYDREVAIELCLIYISNLSDTYFVSLESDDLDKQNGWKRLNHQILNDQLKIDNDDSEKEVNKLRMTIRTFLVENNIIEIIYKWSTNHSIRHRLSKTYFGKGIVNYTLKTDFCKELRLRNTYINLAKAQNNVIAKNLFSLYPNIQLPTRQEIITEAKRLIDENYTKKGKKLVFKNKHSKDYFKIPVSFVEDAIAKFEYYTERGFMIPQIGDQNSGGRVVDSFTLMPSWIRNLIKINGNKILTADYTALHPNIAIKIYNGTKHYITHKDVSESTGIDLIDVKTEHLSFFNKTWNQMTKSPLFDYYSNTEPKMLENIFWDKTQNNLEEGHKHKITTQKMFKEEVDLMTANISILNLMGIYVGYIYDALFFEPKYLDIVTEILNQNAIKNNIYTSVK